MNEDEELKRRIRRWDKINDITMWVLFGFMIFTVGLAVLSVIAVLWGMS